jgi:UDP-N-acetylmuramoylalanine--D-glutamate ligase
MRRVLLNHKRVLVLGLGVHGGGVAVARWLVKHGAQVTVTDMKRRAELSASLSKLKGLPIRYVLGEHPVSLLAGVELVVRNPAVRQDHPLLQAARARRIPIENEASLFLKLCPDTRLVGVTGSKGKSTTTALICSILKTKYPGAVAAGNIRDTVMFDVLDELTPHTPLVLELSSWQLEEIVEQRLRLPLALVTNVLPEHLNTYRSFAAYASIKAGIFKGQQARDAVVLNYDNPHTRRMGRQSPGRVYWFSLRRVVPRGAYVSKGAVYWKDKGRVRRLFPVSDVTLSGEHNLANCLAASAVASLMGMPGRNIRRAVRAFHGLHDRFELVRVLRRVRFINDTTATAPAAAQAALAAARGNHVVLIAGGVDKQLPYMDMARAIRRYADAVVLLPGSATVKLQRALRGFRHMFLARTMSEAVRMAATLVRPGGMVLLSPGAASFGLFKHEFDRGDKFVAAVRKLT